MKEVFIIFRTFKYNGETVGFAIRNSFEWKDEIDRHYGLPANGYIPFANLVASASLSQILLQDEANQYFATNNSVPDHKHSLAHLFLFSRIECTSFKFNKQPTGFHFVSKRGLRDVSEHKWLRDSNLSLVHTTENDLTREMERSNADVQTFLLRMANSTHNPMTPGTHMGEPTRYVLRKQRRIVPRNCLHLFDKVLSLASRNVHRPIMTVENEFPIETEVDII